MRTTAAVLEKNSEIVVRELDLAPLAEDECLVEVAYAGVCSSDIARAFDSEAYFYPLVMGHEFSGVVKSIGKGVSTIREGQRVAVFPLIPCFNCESCRRGVFAQCSSYKYYGSRNHGGFSRCLAVKAWNLVPIGDAVDLKDAALLEPVAVALHTLRRAGLSSKPEKVILLGAGYIGLVMAEIIAKVYPSVELTVVERNNFKLDYLQPKVKRVVVTSDADWQAALGDSRFDVVIVSTGSAPSFFRSLSLAGFGARVVWMGNIDSDLAIPQKMVSQILRRELEIIGVWNSLYKHPEQDDWQDSLALMDGVIQPTKYVSHVVGLKEFPTILGRMHQHKKRIVEFKYVKVLVSLSS